MCLSANLQTAVTHWNVEHQIGYRPPRIATADVQVDRVPSERARGNGGGDTRTARDDSSGISMLGTSELRSIMRDTSRTTLAIVLMSQEGGPDLSWKARPFWWPMLVSPSGSAPCLFTAKIASCEVIDVISRCARKINPCTHDIYLNRPVTPAY